MQMLDICSLIKKEVPRKLGPLENIGTEKISAKLKLHTL